MLRDGRHVQTRDAAGTNSAEIVRLMIGQPVAEHFPRHAAGPAGPTLLRVNRLSSPPRFENVSFEVRAGEVVGLAGLVGAGRSEIARAVFGIDSIAGGRIAFDGRTVEIRHPQSAVESASSPKIESARGVSWGSWPAGRRTRSRSCG